MRLVIAGEPVPKGRPRFNRSSGTLYTPPETRAYEDAVAMMARASRESYGLSPIKFEAIFFTNKKRPADADNLAKSALDGLNKASTVFNDDSQVCELHVVRVRSKNPRAEIYVEPTEELCED